MAEEERKRIENMTPEEKAELERKKAEAAERQRIKDEAERYIYIYGSWTLTRAWKQLKVQNSPRVPNQKKTKNFMKANFYGI